MLQKVWWKCVLAAKCVRLCLVARPCAIEGKHTWGRGGSHEGWVPSKHRRLQ